MALHSIELCAGVGMLGEGARAAFEFLGIEHRTVCYVEREAAAAAQLIALMEAGALDPAPIWSDLVTFRGREWRGKVDCVIAGFPCQDLSLAGRRAGLDGARSGLFFNVLDVADACGARFLLLENVAGIASATASVVDPEEGELEERAVSRVLGELADRGWDAEWIALSAADVGASHERERWFCVAWRGVGLADPTRHGRNEGRPESSREQARLDAALRNSAMDDAEHAQCRKERVHAGSWKERTGAPDSLRAGQPMANTSCTRFPLRAGGGSNNESLQPPVGSDALCVRGALPFFAPGPLDQRWQGIVTDHPHLAPATEPGVRMLVDGLAYVVDESRTHQLRQIGNGVVPLCAATAFVELLRRSGVMTNFKHELQIQGAAA